MDKLGKICQLRWKKFEGDLFKTNKDIASQSREIFHTFVAVGWGVGGIGHKLAHYSNVC